MAKIMLKAGGYNSFGWRTIVDRIRVRILRRLQFTQASKEAKASNEPVFLKDDRTGGGGAGA